ncbi:MAG: hypothetical protein NTV36_03550, partial [Candidatus Staskawiczbacteria bacterium]|nr:hypothetical protein [Candidatus Staskawiczbacteria bacterium]
EKTVQRTVNESRLPNEEFESTVGVYGGKIKIEDGKMVWNNKGPLSTLDKTGDALLRIYDEHPVKDIKKLAKKHPKTAAQKIFAPGTKRYRGNKEEIAENIERLGLSEFYGPHKNGIEIKNPEIYTKGLALQDIYRSDLIDSGKLKETDRFQALAEAAKYIRAIHDNHGGIGEVLVSDIIFQENENGKLGKPVLNLPDIVWNKKKATGEKDKKTTDMLDFLSSVYGEELRRSQNPEEAERALDTVISNYGDKDIVTLIESFIKRGRLTLQGDTKNLNLPNTITKKARGIFSQHNKARLASKTSFEGEMKEKIKQACQKFLSKE